jgi:hypothetical protein
MQTGILLSPTDNRSALSVPDSRAFAIKGIERCGVTDLNGQARVDVPAGHKANVVALLPPDTVLTAHRVVGAIDAGVRYADGRPWRLSNVDEKPYAALSGVIDQPGTYTLRTMPSTAGLHCCFTLDTLTP